MQQDKTPMPEVDKFDPDIDRGAGRGPGWDQTNDDGVSEDEIPLPPDVEDRESIEEPDPKPVPIEDPERPRKQIV